MKQKNLFLIPLKWQTGDTCHTRSIASALPTLLSTIPRSSGLLTHHRNSLLLVGSIIFLSSTVRLRYRGTSHKINTNFFIFYLSSIISKPTTRGRNKFYNLAKIIHPLKSKVNTKNANQLTSNTPACRVLYRDPSNAIVS